MHGLSHYVYALDNDLVEMFRIVYRCSFTSDIIILFQGIHTGSLHRAVSNI